MKSLNVITDTSIVGDILEKSVITQKDRFLMDSYVITPLVDFCGDIRPNEIDKVHEVEDDSILSFLNTVMSVFGKYNQGVFKELLSTYPFNSLIQEIKSTYSGKEIDRIFIIVITKAILANRDLSLKVKAAGNMPQKMFSFRQATADEWFTYFVDRALTRIVSIYENMGVNEATASLFSICAYQLYHSQPNRFDISYCSNENDALALILDTFLKSKNGVGTRVYSKTGELLSKSL